MKAYEIAEAFRAQFAADSDFAGASCEHDQTGGTNLKPAVIFKCAVAPMNIDGTALRFTLTVTASSAADRKLPTDPDPSIAHAALVEKVRAKLLGAGKAALKTALNTGSPAAFDFRGWSPESSELQSADREFDTPIIVSGPVLLL